MNKFLKFSLIKILLLILVGFFHFSALSWEASEDNCTTSGMIGDLQINACPPPETAANGVTRTPPCADRERLDLRKQECRDWKDERREERERERELEEEEREREEEEREREEKALEEAEQAQLDFAKEQAEQAEKERQKALEEQQKILDQAKNECTSSYDQVVRERGRIESQVQNVQQQMDQIEDQITKAYASISKAEDDVQEGILQLKQGERQAMNSFKQERMKAEQAEQQGDRALQQAIEEIENTLFESSVALEDIADFQEQICSNRSAGYLSISVACYNEKLTQVAAERDELFKRIRAGQYTAQNVSQLFRMDAQTLEQTFKRRLDALHNRCFYEKTGENLPQTGQSLAVQIPCDLEAFEARAKHCKEKNNNHRVCPSTPNAQEIEQKVLVQLKKMDTDRKKIERAREKALKDIEKLKEEHKESEEWMAKALADLAEQLRLAKQDFKEQHERAENELLRVREQAENEILRLERDKIRLLASDPARHFEEQLIKARVSCCNSVNPQQTAQQCALLTRYEQDPARFQFAFARSLPALRSTSGPSPRANDTSRRADGGIR